MATYPGEWAKLGKQFPNEEETSLAGYLTSLIQKRGTLEVLRNGISFSGVNLQLAYFRPSAGGNPEHHLRYRTFEKALEKAGLRRIRIHDLRATYATLRIQAGHNIADVSRQLGHHSIKVTVDTYYKWMPGNNSDEVNDLDLKTAPIRNLSATRNKEGVNHIG